MLPHSQPLNDEISTKLEARSGKSETDQKIKDQFIGTMEGTLLKTSRFRKVGVAKRLKWKFRRLEDKLRAFRRSVRNHLNWHKTISDLYPQSGFSGLIGVMQTQLQEYLDHEEKYGVAEESFKAHKISTVKETMEILDRLKEPDEYLSHRRKAVEEKYPEYQQLVTRYENGGVGFSGDFVALGKGWVGRESGTDPREGYFEFQDGEFVLAESPNPVETKRLLDQLQQYDKEITLAYKQAEEDSDQDFEKLGQLLKDHLFEWWD